MRLIGWVLLALCLCLVQHARLTAWPLAPDLPLALAAWAAACGDERAWMLRVWLVGAVRDRCDPGSQWFHAAAHLALAIAIIPLRRWFPAQPWLALAVVGAGMSLAVQAMDCVVAGPAGWHAWHGLAQTALTGAAAVAVGWLMPPPAKRTVPAPAEEAPPAAADTAAEPA